jgi:hypothetical protein
MGWAQREDAWMYLALMLLAGACFAFGFGGFPYFLRRNKADTQEFLDKNLGDLKTSHDRRMRSGASFAGRLYKKSNVWIGVYSLAVMWVLGAFFLFIVFMAAAEPDGLIYEDDFSDSETDPWPRESSQLASLDYYSGGYRIRVNEPDYWYWVMTGGAPLNNVRVEADVQRIGGELASSFGLICRARTDQQFYVGWISDLGEYALLESVTYGWRTITSGTTTLPGGDAPIRLRLDCVGSTLELSINGLVVASASDDALTSGNVGFAAGSPLEGDQGADVLFDNFVLIDLGGNEDALGVEPPLWLEFLTRLGGRLIGTIVVIAILIAFNFLRDLISKRRNKKKPGDI